MGGRKEKAMKNHKTKLKTLGALTTVGLSLFTFASVSAWGPERATFTMEKPATYPTFNSITDNYFNIIHPHFSGSLAKYSGAITVKHYPKHYVW